MGCVVPFFSSLKLSMISKKRHVKERDSARNEKHKWKHLQPSPVRKLVETSYNYEHSQNTISIIEKSQKEVYGKWETKN